MRALALLTAAVLAGCATTGPALEADAPTSADALVLYLEDRGFTLVPDGLTSSTVPLTTATTYRVEGVASPAVLEVFEFESDQAARDGLAQLRAETRARVQRDLYARGPLVVRLEAAEYRRGSNSGLRLALARALGTPRGDA